MPWPWRPRWPVTPRWRPGSRCAAPRNNSPPPATGRPRSNAPPPPNAGPGRKPRNGPAAAGSRPRRAAAVAGAVEQAIGFIDVSVELARRERDSAEERREQLDRELPAVRTGNDALARELAELTDSVHRDELARAQQRLRIEALELQERRGARADAGPARGRLRPGPARAGPCRRIGGQMGRTARPGGRGRTRDCPRASPSSVRNRKNGSKRAERDLAALGKVNPLALEEFAALEERHQFLSTQLEDLKSSRKDLLDIIKEVDDRVQQVFAEAFEDTSPAVRPRLRPAVPRRRGPAGPDRPVGHAHHRHRGGGPAGRQEDQAALAALRRRTVPDGRGAAGGHLQGPALAVLRHGRGGGRAGRHQPGPAASPSSKSSANPAS